MKALWRRFIRQRTAVVALGLLLALALLSQLSHLGGVLNLPLQPEERFRPPGWEHWLGTDYAGRDVARQLLHGARDVLAVSVLTGLFAVMIGGLVGICAGWAGGWIDAVLTVTTDAFLTVPSFPVMAVAAALLQLTSAVDFALLLACWSWAALARSVRGQTLALKRQEFVEAAELHQMGSWHIIVCEIAPNLLPLLLVYGVRIARDAVGLSVGIMLLGLVPLRVENWGMMLNMAAVQSGALYVPGGQTYFLAPLLALLGFQRLLSTVAEGLEAALEPVRT